MSRRSRRNACVITCALLAAALAGTCCPAEADLHDGDVVAHGLPSPEVASLRAAPPGFGSPSPVDPATRVYQTNILTAVDALGPDDAWAVGDDLDTGPLLEHWDGHTWQSFLGPVDVEDDVYLNAVEVVSADDAWAVGDRFVDGGASVRTLALHWDGVTWSAVPTPHFGYHSTLAAVSGTSADDVWAVGSFTAKTPRVPDRTLALHWDGISWQRFATSSPGGHRDSWLYGVTALAPDDVWTVGAYDEREFDRNQTLAEHWDGSRWTREHMGNPGSGDRDVLYAISGTAGDRVVAVGAHQIKGSSTFKPLVEAWDGSAWRHVFVRHCGLYLPLFYAVSAVEDGGVWAAGVKGFSGPGYHAATCSWDGVSWTAHKSRSPGHRNVNGTGLNGISMVSDRRGWAVGFYGGQHNWHPFIEQWNGIRWLRDRVG